MHGRTGQYAAEIRQMLYVLSEKDPSSDVVGLLEQLIRASLIEFLLQTKALCARRGGRAIGSEDVIFLIRHERAKVNRLRTFLSWKEVRKGVKEASTDVATEDLVGATAGGDDSTAAIQPAQTSGPGSGSLDPGHGHAQRVSSTKRILKLPWEIPAIYTDGLGDLDKVVRATMTEDASAAAAAGGDEEDEYDPESVEIMEDSKARLREADEATAKMDRDEYIKYSECRQASFTYRKAKRFREWLNLSHFIDVPLSNDITDILGYLSCEMVQEIVLEAQKVRKEQDQIERTALRSRSASTSTSLKRKRGSSDTVDVHRKKVTARQNAVRQRLGSPPRGLFARRQASEGDEGQMDRPEAVEESHIKDVAAPAVSVEDEAASFKETSAPVLDAPSVQPLANNALQEAAEKNTTERLVSGTEIDEEDDDDDEGEVGDQAVDPSLDAFRAGPAPAPAPASTRESVEKDATLECVGGSPLCAAHLVEAVSRLQRKINRAPLRRWHGCVTRTRAMAL